MSSIYQSGEIVRDRYHITGVLGQGGVAITYRAIDLKTNSPVAIKVISLRQLSDWKQVELFQREAEVLKQLSHPHIPDYIGYFDLETATDKTFYLVQQITPGKSLSQLVESGWRTNEKKVKNIARQVLEILAYLHSLDPPVIHRDIKPSNLILSDEGKVYLVDFGAVQNTYYNTLMQSSTVVGTYGYMAPEQFRGQALPATDLYSLGATLLYLLTHRSPAELPQDTLKLDFRNSIDISESFADWLDKILEPDVEDRFDNADVAIVELSKSNNNKRNKFLTGIGAIVLFIGLITGINSHKWFFLNNIGFYPDSLCSPTILQNYFKQGGKISFVAEQKMITFLFCALENENIETEYLINVLEKIDRNSIEEYDVISAPLRGRQSLINIAIIEERYEIIPLLIELGADVNYEARYHITPIFRAIRNDRLDIAQLLIDRGAKINIRDNTGKPLLLDAFDYGSIESVKLLIENGADVNIENEQGDTPLIIAIHKNNADLARILIENGANLNCKKRSGETALFYAIDEKKLKIAKLLIESGADVNLENDVEYSESYPKTALYKPDKLLLFNYKNSYETAKALIDNGADINARDEHDSTPLFTYSSVGNKEIVKHLIKLGVDVNKRDRFGSTALFKVKDREIARLLIQNKANVDAKNNSGQTPLFGVPNKDIAQILIENGADINARDRYDRTPLFEAIDKDAVQLLIDNGANLNARDKYNHTSLFGARDKGVVQLLIDNGIDYKSKDDRGRTPLFGIGDKEAAQLLVNLGIEINERDNFGQTALFETINPYIAKSIIDLGADVDATDNWGETALFNAVKKEDEYMVELLIEMKANINHRNNNAQTPLFFSNNKQIAKLLIDRGAEY